MKELVELVCGGLGLSLGPADLVESREGQDVTVTVTLSAGALRRLDGPDHRLARALRQVLSTAAVAQDARFHLVAKARE